MPEEQPYPQQPYPQGQEAYPAEQMQPYPAAPGGKQADPANPVDQSGAFLADFNVKLRDIEEKQNLIKDRILLIGENLVSEKQETEKELTKLKEQVKVITSEIKKMKLVIQRVVESQENFARKSEVQILQRQFKMFQPLEFARIKDVKDLIKEALEKR